MIDNIWFTFVHTPSPNWIESLNKNFTLNPIYRNRKIKAYIGKIYLKKSVTKRLNDNGTETIKKVSTLLVKIKMNEDGTVRVVVMNSLRKWYYNDATDADFSKDSFLKCLIKVAEKMNVPLITILDSKVTRVEYGSSINLRESFRCFYNCIYSHRDIPKKMTVGSETLMFDGENKKVIFYDKITERKASKQMSAKTERSINKIVISLRYEIKKTKITQGDIEYKYMKRLGDILDNWNIIIDLWVNELDKITFVNNMTPKIYDYLKDTQIKNLTNYLTYLGLEKLGIENLQTILSDRALLKKRGILNKKFIENYNYFRSLVEEEDFEFMFKQKVLEKGEKLRA